MYYFSSRTKADEEEIFDGICKYQRFFPQANPYIKFVGEKTPFYSYDTLAPYRAGAMLQKPMKFIYTYRDDIEAEMSLYLYRGSLFLSLFVDLVCRGLSLRLSPFDFAAVLPSLQYRRHNNNTNNNI